MIILEILLFIYVVVGYSETKFRCLFVLWWVVVRKKDTWNVGIQLVSQCKQER